MRTSATNSLYTLGGAVSILGRTTIPLRTSFRRIRFSEAERTVRVEYDATRMNQDTVAALLRRTGLELGDKLQLV